MTHEELVGRILEEFNDRSNDRMFCEGECKSSFWFEEGDEIRYDQDEAAKWLEKQFTTYRAQVLEEGQKKCEVMLDKEAERVAKSVLQLIGSINFKVNDVLDPDVPQEAIHTANKIAYAVKEVLTKEITKTFIEHPTN